MRTEGAVISPLNWWNENKGMFRVLSNMAGDYFSIKPSSTSSKRLFSKAGRAITNIRNRISDDTAESSIFMNCWMD